MSLGRLRARKLRGWVVLPLLPVLALRLLVPEGFMPRFGEHLELSVQMCHGDSRSAAAMRMLQDEVPAPAGHDGEDGQQHSACTFAATAAATPPDATPALLGALTGPTTEPLPRLAAPALSLHHRPQSPRAPPHLV